MTSCPVCWVRSCCCLWWVGLGMSFDATDRAKEAGDAFRQARQIGRLSADMNSYIEQRLRHLP